MFSLNQISTKMNHKFVGKKLTKQAKNFRSFSEINIVLPLLINKRETNKSKLRSEVESLILPRLRLRRCSTQLSLVGTRRKSDDDLVRQQSRRLRQRSSLYFDQKDDVISKTKQKSESGRKVCRVIGLVVKLKDATRQIRKCPLKTGACLTACLALLEYGIQEHGETSILDSHADEDREGSPLLRFRKAVRMIQLLLRATLSNRPTQINDVKFLSWAHYQDEILSSKRSYEMVGLSFDPSNYRAKREISLSNEAKNILSMTPSDRTKDQLKIALLALNQTVEAFSEFPITMQKSLVRVGWYEHFEDKRVIIRQGHMADNFYFILSGTAIVTKLETDIQTGEEITRTVAVLKKGNSFGELALMHGARRSATVICKEEVELLAVGREDFVDVFMPIDSKQEPEHIRFLRSVDVFSSWPIEKLPYHDPKICCFTYFRRGLLLCKDSNSSEWLYIIKTGSCRVLKALYCTKPNIKGLKSKSSDASSVRLPPLNSPTSSTSSSSPSSDLSLLQQSMQREESKRRRHGYTLGYLHNIMSKPPEEIALTLLEHRQTIDDVYKSKTVSRSYKASRKKREREEQALEAKKEKIPKVYVQIQKLGPRDSYGIEQVAFGMIDKTTSVILVSDGAECILINKKFFKQHLTDRAAKDIRRTYQPLPTEESLQQKLQDKTNWEAYKAMTVVKYVSNKQAVHDSLFF